VSPVEALIPLLAILSVFVFFPWIVLNYLSKRRESAAAQAGDPLMNTKLQAIAGRLEKRVQALETILDAEVPGWRKHMDRRDS
jgi:phage shock protein B